MNRKTAMIVFSLAFMTLSLTMAIAVQASPTPFAEGWGCMKVEGQCVCGPAVLHMDGSNVLLTIKDDSVVHRPTWSVENHYTICRLEIYKCYNQWRDSRLLIVISRSNVIALGRGVFFCGTLI